MGSEIITRIIDSIPSEVYQCHILLFAMVLRPVYCPWPPLLSSPINSVADVLWHFFVFSSFAANTQQMQIIFWFSLFKKYPATFSTNCIGQFQRGIIKNTFAVTSPQSHQLILDHNSVWSISLADTSLILFGRQHIV